MSKASNPLHPKRAGSSVESVVIDREPALQFVSDRDAEWHDAVSTDLMTPTDERPFGGVCVVERDTPVEIKWYPNRGRDVARLRWTALIDEERVTRGGHL